MDQPSLSRPVNRRNICRVKASVTWRSANSNQPLQEETNGGTTIATEATTSATPATARRTEANGMSRIQLGRGANALATPTGLTMTEIAKMSLPSGCEDGVDPTIYQAPAVEGRDQDPARGRRLRRTDLEGLPQRCAPRLPISFSLLPPSSHVYSQCKLSCTVFTIFSTQVTRCLYATQQED